MGGLVPGLSGDDGAFGCRGLFVVRRGVGSPLGVVSLVCESGANLVLLRVGVDAAGDGIFGHLSRSDAGASLCDPDVADSMDLFSEYVWRWADQAAGRPLLVGFHL